MRRSQVTLLAILASLCLLVAWWLWPASRTEKPEISATENGTEPPGNFVTANGTEQARPGLVTHTPTALGLDTPHENDAGHTPPQIAAAEARARASDGSSGGTYEHRGVFDLIYRAARECYQLAAERQPGLVGDFHATLRFATDDDLGNIIGTVTIDEGKTNVHDPLLVECIKENVFLAEQVLEAANSEGKAALWGNTSAELVAKFPLKERTEPDWPGDDAFPVCPEGTTARQADDPMKRWCEDAEGIKQGDEYIWVTEGELGFILEYEDGVSTTAQMRPVDD